jgi:hypothetical protein
MTKEVVVMKPILPQTITTLLLLHVAAASPLPTAHPTVFSFPPLSYLTILTTLSEN